MRACFYCAPENVFQSVFETVYVCFFASFKHCICFLEFLRVFISVCACVCVRAGVRVSTVLLSLCLLIVVPVFQCPLSFSLPCF